MRQHGEHGFAPRTLETPDGETTQPDTDIMGVPWQAPASATGGGVCELKAKREEKGEDTLDKRLALVEQTTVGGFLLESDDEGAVVPCPLGCVAHVSPLYHQVSSVDETR